MKVKHEFVITKFILIILIDINKLLLIEYKKLILWKNKYYFGLLDLPT